DGEIVLRRHAGDDTQVQSVVRPYGEAKSGKGAADRQGMPGDPAAGSDRRGANILMISRRHFLYLSAAAARAGAQMSSRENVDHVLKGQPVDRPPFSFWHHFGLEKLPGDRQAEATLNFH